jgi:5'-deoxynucleotidase YfbR-like HD superfamily hydrolase
LRYGGIDDNVALAQDDSFDQNKCVRMALIHDIGEAIIGDITPSDGVSKSTWQPRRST